MSAINKDDVTSWTTAQGYFRTRPSAEWCAFVDDESGRYIEALFEFGYSRINSSTYSHEDADCFELLVFQHEKTKELIVDLDNSDGGMARVFIPGEYAESFLFTEFLRIREQVGRINNADYERITHKALLAFIRHGHGKSTISEEGETLDERQIRIAGERARREREQAAKSKA